MEREFRLISIARFYIRIFFKESGILFHPIARYKLRSYMYYLVSYIPYSGPIIHYINYLLLDILYLFPESEIRLLRYTFLYFLDTVSQEIHVCHDHHTEHHLVRVTQLR